MTREELLSKLEAYLAQKLEDRGVSASIHCVKNPPLDGSMDGLAPLGSPEPAGDLGTSGELFGASGGLFGGGDTLGLAIAGTDAEGEELEPDVLELVRESVQEFVEQHRFEFAALFSEPVDPKLLN